MTDGDLSKHVHHMTSETMPLPGMLVGHERRHISCTCGFKVEFPNKGTIEEVTMHVLIHRINVLEEAVGIDFKLEYKI